MSNELTPQNPTAVQRREATPEQKYGAMIESLASRELERIATTPEGRAATARVALAFRAAARSAQNPAALYNCDPASVAACVVNSALYNIMPGGAMPGVYLVPKGNTLGWWLNHRGIIELARRSGYRVVAKAHFTFDEFEIEYGLNPKLSHRPGEGDATWQNLVGVYVIVYDAATGQPLDYLDMPKRDIEARRKKAGQQGVWNEWPIEMSLKSAIKYAAARGVISLDEIGRQALEADHDNVIDITPVPAVPVQSSPRAIAQRDRFDEAVGVTAEPTHAEVTDDAPSGGK